MLNPMKILSRGLSDNMNHVEGDQVQDGQQGR